MHVRTVHERGAFKIKSDVKLKVKILQDTLESENEEVVYIYNDWLLHRGFPQQGVD